MLTPYLSRLAEGESLTEEEAAQAMRFIVTASASPAQIGAYLALLRAKGETVEEILGSARVVRERTTRVHPTRPALIDTCGTGGDGSFSFNVSTAAALVAAGAGLAVAKHGNRSISSRCGSADLLEVCGVPLDLEPGEAAATIDEAGIGFLFAPALNGAMASVAPLRREIRIRTVFNLMGPLANPAGARRQLLGVYAGRWVEPLARVLQHLGSERALVVHGSDGLDEISISGATEAALLDNGTLQPLTLTPESFGLVPSPRGVISAGDPMENRRLLASVLAGEPGPFRDATVANAGAAIWIGGGAGGPLEGARLAAETIDSGRARAALDRLVSVSRRLREQRAGAGGRT